MANNNNGIKQLYREGEKGIKQGVGCMAIGLLGTLGWLTLAPSEVKLLGLLCAVLIPVGMLWGMFAFGAVKHAAELENKK